MELLFRKYFWAVNLAFLLVAAYLVARIANTWAAYALSPAPQFEKASRPAPIAEVAKTALAAEALSKVTGIALPVVEEVAVADPLEPALPDFDSQVPVKTGLRVKLGGTMVANVDEWSLATIEDLTTHTSNVYMVGDEIQGAKVYKIERLRVLIDNQGRKEFIDTEGGDGSSVAVAPPVAPPHGAVAARPPPADTGTNIREIAENQYQIPKDEITKALSNLNDIAMQARIVPAFKDGVSTGFKLFSIRPNSLYSKIGIQNGDVVRRINGFDINSPDKALEVYTKLKESSRIEIELERNGSPLRSSSNVQ